MTCGITRPKVEPKDRVAVAVKLGEYLLFGGVKKFIFSLFFPLPMHGHCMLLCLMIDLYAFNIEIKLMGLKHAAMSPRFQWNLRSHFFLSGFTYSFFTCAQGLALQLSNSADPGAGPQRLYGKYCVMFRIEVKKGKNKK